MARQTVFMFSGHGCQYHRMGAELYAHHPVFKNHLDRCDHIARPLLSASLSEFLYRKSEPFDRLLHTNPALVSIQYSLAQVLLDAGIRPDLLLGYGLGEIVASTVAGLVAWEDALRLVIGMSRLIEEKTSVMEIAEAMAAPGPLDEIPPLSPECLGVNNRILDSLAAELKALGAAVPLRRASIPIVSACRRWVLREPDADYFWKIVRYAGEFESTIEGLLEMGDFAFIDAGPSGTLATLVERLLPPGSRSIALQAMNRTQSDLLSLEILGESLCNPAENRTTAR